MYNIIFRNIMVKDNILEIDRRIASACSRSAQAPDSVTIVAVTKGRAADQIKEAIGAGIADIGENRIQEALLKYNDIGDKPVKWHMVGHLQTNKVRQAIKIFDLIHSVDSLELAARIDKESSGIGKRQDILMQVNVSGEATKFGFGTTEAIRAAAEIAGLKNINLKGLMTIAPLVDEPEKARPYFKQLRQLKDRINGSGVTAQGLRILSMGMSDDFEVAIEEGSNMVRLGRVIFSRQ